MRRVVILDISIEEVNHLSITERFSHCRFWLFVKGFSWKQVFKIHKTKKYGGCKLLKLAFLYQDYNTTAHARSGRGKKMDDTSGCTSLTAESDSQNNIASIPNATSVTGADKVINNKIDSTQVEGELSSECENSAVWHPTCCAFVSFSAMWLASSLF